MSVVESFISHENDFYHHFESRMFLKWASNRVDDTLAFLAVKPFLSSNRRVAMFFYKKHAWIAG